MEARLVNASNGKLVVNVAGEIAKDEGVLLIRRIHMAMQLVASEESRSTVERVHGSYAMHCTLYHTLHNAIQLPSSYALVSPRRADSAVRITATTARRKQSPA